MRANAAASSSRRRSLKNCSSPASMQLRRGRRGTGGGTGARAPAPAGRSWPASEPSARRRGRCRRPARCSGRADDGRGSAPGVQHGGDADVGAEVLGIGGDRGQRLGRRREQQAVDLGLVLVGDGADRGRQREHDVEVGDRQQLGLARLKPRLPPPAIGTSGNGGCGRSCRRCACARSPRSARRDRRARRCGRSRSPS